MTRVGLIGSYGGLNTGDEAIFTCLSREIGRVLPDAELVVFSRDAGHTSANYPGHEVVPVRELSRDEVAPIVRGLDLLVLGGGGILFDAEVRNFLREVRLAQSFGVPTFAASVGAGPLAEQEARQLVSSTMNSMNGITVRDSDAKRLLEEVGVDAPIEVTADPAWLLEGEDFSDEMLANEGINARARLVGFSVREPGSAAPGLDESAYHHLLADAADFAVERYGSDIVFVPMERTDVRHSHLVIAQMSNADHASVLKGSYRPGQVLDLVGRFELAVGMRLHFLIFAAIRGVPFLPLPYASKVTSMLRSLDLPLETMVQEGRAGPLLASVDRIWDGRHDRSRHLKDRVPGLQARARRTADALAEVVREPDATASARHGPGS